MMRGSSLLWVVCLTAVMGLVAAQEFQGGDSIYQFTVQDIDGNPVSLETYRGKVLLIVNVASRCGYTPQYKGLQSLYERFRERGFAVLGFPANNFRNQEPGTNEEIKAFCRNTYGVTFPMFAKISVRGVDIHPLYAYLTSRRENPRYAGEITWNFNKFLIDRFGRVAYRFGTTVKPESGQIVQAVKNLLEQRP